MVCQEGCSGYLQVFYGGVERLYVHPFHPVEEDHHAASSRDRHKQRGGGDSQIAATGGGRGGQPIEGGGRGRAVISKRGNHGGKGKQNSKCEISSA